MRISSVFYFNSNRTCNKPPRTTFPSIYQSIFLTCLQPSFPSPHLTQESRGNKPLMWLCYGGKELGGKSSIHSFLDKNEARYNPKMSPIIPKEKWRKGSQWIALIRKHAEVIVADDAIFQVFKKFCKKSVGQKEHNCISDEHYMQTSLSMRELGNELEQRTLTYTSWNHSTSEAKKQSWHPMTFEYANATPQHISEIKNINHIYYETEHRTEWCQSNATSVPCFLFARKFSRGAAMRLLSEEFGGLFDPPALH